MINNLNIFLEHTILKPQFPLGEYTQAARDCINYNFPTLVVNPFHVPLVSNLLNAHPESKIQVCSVIAFPFGLSDIHTKSIEIERAISKGANELDVVINLSLVKTHEWKHLKEEMIELREASDHYILKVILEVGLLTIDEIKSASLICLENNVDFLKTSTGVNVKLEPAKTAEYVALLRDLSNGTKCKVKASGGIKTLADCQLMIAAGATRIGTSSGVSIVQEVNGR